ncbi:TonB-dependent receptor [Cryomorphaceae bacterium]|nr:TonB-dependent receptor [Cryomorphaceae bacterium]
MKKISFIIALLWSAALWSQESYTVSGYLTDEASGESLIGANVFEPAQGLGTSTNAYGFYSLTLKEGFVNIRVSYLGYKEESFTFKLDADTVLSLPLRASSLITDEVIVTADSPDKNVQSADMGRVDLKLDIIRQIPVVGGEVDVLKSIQLLPGVQSAAEGSSGFFVRGGGADQNLILLDEAVVYNASHLLGFFSIFNADALKNVELIKGGMPANYGGRLSSVLEISQRDGNYKRHQQQGGIGLIASRITAEGPIVENRSSYLFSARRTYVDLFLDPFINGTEFEGNSYFFYDLNLKLNHRITDKDRIFFSGYFGRDDFVFQDPKSEFETAIPWGNATASLRWNHLFSDKLFVNTTAVFSDYYFQYEASNSSFDYELFSGVQDWTLKTDFSFHPNPKNRVKFGANYIRHIITPSNVGGRQQNTSFGAEGVNRQHAHEAAVYALNDFDVTNRLRINVGMRVSFFSQVGPFDRYLKDPSGSIEDTVSYRTGETVQSYLGWEPRFSMRYRLQENSSIKVGAVRNYQYIHLVTFSALGLPSDLWLPSSDIIKPQIGHQYSIGYFQNFRNNTFEFSVEAYYKELENLVAYKEGVTPNENVADNPDNNLTFGTGEAYGVEFFLKKNTGKLTGWIGYTWSRSIRYFPELNEGNTFLAIYDRPNDISVALNYRLNDRWSFGSVFVYGTGANYTPPKSRYMIDGRLYTEWGPRNSKRLPAYHRLDLSATWIAKKTERFESSFVFSVYNAYNRQNPFFIFFDDQGSILEGTYSLSAQQVTLFPILPSITWNFKFL